MGRRAVYGDMMQAMKAVQRALTYPELRMMPHDAKRYERIDGEVFVAPSPDVKHQKALGRLFLRMANHVEVKTPERSSGETAIN